MSSSVNDVGWLWKPLKIAQATAEGESFTSLRESFALMRLCASAIQQLHIRLHRWTVLVVFEDGMGWRTAQEAK